MFKFGWFPNLDKWAMSKQLEVELSGGRVTIGVVRVGDTVRRPVGPQSKFVHELLSHLEVVGFRGAPRFHGLDEKGREILDYIKGEVPADLGWLDDAQIAGGARLLRELHDATAGSSLARGREVVCHGDASPCNAVFSEGIPVAWIDFDGAYAGRRMADVGYAAWAWLDIGLLDCEPAEVGRRLGLFGGHYRVADPFDLVDAVVAAQRRLLRQCDPTIEEGPRGRGTANWCRTCIRWTLDHKKTLREKADASWAEVVRDR